MKEIIADTIKLHLENLYLYNWMQVNKNNKHYMV